MQQYLEAGKVVTTHGVRGEMKLELWCDGVDFLKKVGRLYPSVQGGKACNIICGEVRMTGTLRTLSDKTRAMLKERIAPYVDAESIRYLRFPVGSTNTVSRRYGGKGLMKQLKAEVEQKGWHWVDWNVCAEDAVGGHPSAGTIYRNVVHETGQQTNCIVLMHDSSSTHTTAEALPDIIRWYADNGYTFLTVAEALPVR